jgi:hypothetical protein
MSRSRAVSIFTWLGSAILLLAVTVVSYTQGGGFILSDILKVDQLGPVRLAYYSIAILGALTFLAGLVLIVAMREAKPGDAPVPLLFSKKEEGEEENPRAIILVVYQIIVLIAVFGTSIYAIGHANRVLTRGVIWNEALPSTFAVPVQCAMPEGWQHIVKPCPESDRHSAELSFLVFERGIKGSAARLWLANTRHDIVTSQRMAIDQQEMRSPYASVASREESSAYLRIAEFRKQHGAAQKLLDDPRLGNLLTPPSSPPQASVSSGSRGRSQSCKVDTTGCRGDQWLPQWSPFGIIFMTLAGWGSSLAAFLLGGIAIVRRCHQHVQSSETGIT